MNWKPWTEETRQCARDLLLQACVETPTVDSLDSDDKLELAIRIAMDIWADGVPEAHPDWWCDVFRSLTTDHWVLVDEGWIPAEMNTREVTGEDPMQVYAEINGPANAAAFL